MVQMGKKSLKTVLGCALPTDSLAEEASFPLQSFSWLWVNEDLKNANLARWDEVEMPPSVYPAETTSWFGRGE